MRLDSQACEGIDIGRGACYAKHMEKPPFRELLRQVMEQKGVSQRELARRSGKNISTISFTLQGKTWADKYPPLDDIEAYARALGVPVAQLRGDETLPDAPPSLKRPAPWMFEPATSLLRRLGARPFEAYRETEQAVSAGRGKGVIQQDGGGRSRRRREPDEWVVVRVEGRCMYPEIKPGEEVLVEPDITPNIGDLVVATLDGECLVLKHLVERENVQYLLPLNGEPIPLDERTELRIVGVVRGVVTPPPRPRKW